MVDNLKARIMVDHRRLHHLTNNNINNSNIHSNSSTQIKVKINHLAITKEVVMEIDEIYPTTFSKFKI